jgi:hypothetical protein
MDALTIILVALVAILGLIFAAMLIWQAACGLARRDPPSWASTRYPWDET